MRTIILAILVMLCGCATQSVRGHFELVDGKYEKVPNDYMTITGQGSEAEYSDGYKIKSGKVLPDNIGIPKVEIDK